VGEHRVGDEHYYAQELFAQDELTGCLRNMLLDTKRSIYEHVVWQSTPERDLADALEKNDGVVLRGSSPFVDSARRYRAIHESF
jgi:type III restriction enzyme